MKCSIKHGPSAVSMLLALHALLFSTQLFAAPGNKAGPELAVNSFKDDLQRNAAVTMDANGNFVAVWHSRNQKSASSGFDIYMQNYTAAGVAAGTTEVLVNTTTDKDQSFPDIAANASGDYVVVWQSKGQDVPGEATNYGIYAQRYNAAGAKQGIETLINTTTPGSQTLPRVAMDADGDYVITWTGSDASGTGVYMQRFDSAGAAVGSETRVNTTTTGIQERPSVALDANGDVVITWQSQGQDAPAETTNYGIYAQRYNAAGAAQGSELLVNTITAGSQTRPRVAMDASGNFVIVWASPDTTTDDGIYLRRYSADGVAAGSEIAVNTVITGEQYNPVVSLDASGDFVVAWESLEGDGIGNGYGIVARRYSANGVALDVAETVVNTTIAGDQYNSGVALDADGDFVVIWQGPDSGIEGVYAQRFEGAGNFSAGTVDLSLVVNDDTDPVTAGNNFVYSLITTNNGSGIALDLNLSEPVPAGLTYVSDDSASAGWSCALSVATLACNKPYMDPAAVSTLNVTVTAGASTAATVNNTVVVNAAQTDVNAANNTATESTIVVAVASSSSSGGALGVFTLLLALPLWLRRRLIR